MNQLQRIAELETRRQEILGDLNCLPLIQNENSDEDNLFEAIAEAGQYREELQQELYENQVETKHLESHLASLSQEEFNKVNEEYKQILKTINYD